MELFKKLNDEGTTIVQVTHSETNAAYGNRIVRLERRWLVKENSSRSNSVTAILMQTPSSPTLPPSTPPSPRALIADDQPDVLIALRLLLRNAGYQTEAVTSPAEVLAAIQQSNFDLVLMDLNYARDTTRARKGSI